MTRLRTLEIGTAAAAAAVVGALVLVGDAPPHWGWVAVFVVLVIAAENTSVFLSGVTFVSASFMAVMALIAVLDGMGHETLLSAAIVGACAGLCLESLRKRRFTVVLTNCAQFCLASVAAAGVFQFFAGRSELTGLAVALAATCAFGVVNIGLVLPNVALRHGERLPAVWADMRMALPNYLAFGLLGLFIGLVCVRVGPIAVGLITVPMAIGRWTFSSFQRTKDAHEATIRLFIRLIEAKDAYTAGHTERVAKYAMYIAEELELTSDRSEHLRHAALMHDVGKLAVPSHLLNKPGRLTAEEYEVVRRHNDAGIGILARVDFMRGMAVTASDRHAHFASAMAEAPSELVLEAQIVAVADAFDAMTSTRSYRQALDHDVALQELRDHAGTQFNPTCVDALVAALERRGERFGLGHELAHPFSEPPPVVGVGSAGLGDLSEGERS